jgi:predicted DNA-binding transcriptional regulator AlpA
MTRERDVSRISLQLRDCENTVSELDDVPAVSSPSSLLTSAQLAERLAVPESWVRARTRGRTPRAERLPHIALGRYVRFQWAEVAAWLSSRTERS